MNPALEDVEEQHIEWMLRRRLLTADQIDAYRELGYTSLVARYLPEAHPEDLLVIADLTGMSFLMDDATEEPGTAESLATLFGEFARVMADHDYSPGGSVMAAWKEVWDRLIRPMSPDWRERAHGNWRACFAAFRQERQIRDQGRTARLPEYTFTHRVSVGADVYNDMIERAYHFELDPFINAMPAVQMLRWTAAEHIYQVNDLLSLEKDEQTGDDNNLIRVLQHTRGYQRDSAVQLVLDRCNRLVDDFTATRLTLENTIEYQTAEDATRKDIDRFVDGLANWMVAALDWSFDTARYRVFDGEGRSHRTSG